MEDIKFFGVVFLICVSAVNAGEYCSYYNDYSVDGEWGSMNTMWCSGGCCGDTYSPYCCAYYGVGAIVGIVIGTICGVILLVSFIVAICCCCRKSRGQAGQVCQPSPVIQPDQQIAYGVPNANVAYGAPVGYNNTGFIQTTTMTTGTTIPQAPMQPNPYAQAPMQPNPYAQAPPKYEELNIPPQQVN